MRSFILMPLIAVALLSCREERADRPATATTHPIVPTVGVQKATGFQYGPYEGCEVNGAIYTHFDCPDDLSFPPVNIKLWNRVPVVKGRLPTYDEVKYGMAIHHYGGLKNPYVKPYDDITLPKLAYVHSSFTGKQELVIVIQIVRSYTDTVAGYRYLTGGVGGSLLRDFRFLTEAEIKKVVG